MATPPNDEKKPPAPVTAVRVSEDWWLVRDSHNRVGWVLGRMIDIDVPLDIAQYAEGQRIVAAFVLNQVQDGDKKVAEYLTVLTDRKTAFRSTSTRFASSPGTSSAIATRPPTASVWKACCQ